MRRGVLNLNLEDIDADQLKPALHSVLQSKSIKVIKSPEVGLSHGSTTSRPEPGTRPRLKRAPPVPKLLFEDLATNQMRRKWMDSIPAQAPKTYSSFLFIIQESSLSLRNLPPFPSKASRRADESPDDLDGEERVSSRGIATLLSHRF